MANRLAGSPDRFATQPPAQAVGRGPTASINLVTCHNGFTLADLVPYNAKHNIANPRDDGTEDNYSWNCGVDGPTNDQAVLTLRRRQSRNMLVTLLLSIGVPMMLAGDELRHTQRENNNCWCQDDELSWLDWTSDDGELTALIGALCRLRAGHDELRTSQYTAVDGRPLPGAGLRCYGTNGEPLIDADLDADGQHALAVLFDEPLGSGPRLSMLLNAYHQPLQFVIPSSPTGTWAVLVNTAAPFGSPLKPAEAPAGSPLTLAERSAVVLELQ